MQYASETPKTASGQESNPDIRTMIIILQECCNLSHCLGQGQIVPPAVPFTAEALTLRQRFNIISIIKKYKKSSLSVTSTENS
jgi:hypothetical protein